MNRVFGVWFIVLFLRGLVSWSSFAIADIPIAVGWLRSGDQWMSFSTDHFQINYLEIHQEQAERAAIIAEKSWDIITRDLNWEPRDKIQVVLVDDFDFSNGFATPVPFNQIRLFLRPPDNIGLKASYDDWLNFLITHELTHIVHIDMAMGAPSVVRNILGRNFLTFPHAFTPGFMVEGLAVFKETDHVTGTGRGQSSNYEMQMRQEVLNGIDDLSQISLVLRDWPAGKQYLYGYYYYQFLSERYGDEKITEYLNNYSRKLLPYFLQNSTANYTYGKDHEALWLDFKQWLKAKFNPQVERIKQQPLVTGNAITDEGLQSDPVTANRHAYYYVANNGMDRRSIIQIDKNGEKKTVTKTGRIEGMDVTDDNRFLITRFVKSGEGRVWTDIFLFDGDTETRLTHKKRYRKAIWLKQGEGIVAKRIRAGISELDLLSAEGEFVDQLWLGTQGEVLGDFALSNDGRYLVGSVKRKQQGWNLELLDLESREWRALTNTQAIEGGARFSEDDRSILFSADYGETYNLYRMELSSGDVRQLSNVLGGAIQPAQVGENIFYQNYSARGYSHYQLSAGQNVGSFNIATQQASYDYSDLFQQPVKKNEPMPYSAWSTLRPRDWFPVASSDEEQTSIGITTNGADALGRHVYGITLLYDFENEITSGGAVYNYDNKWSFQIQRSHDYDDLDNTDRINVRREDELQIVRRNLFNLFEGVPQISVGMAAEAEQDLTGSGFTSLSEDSKSTVVGIRLDFDIRERYSQSFGPSWGNRSSLVLETYDAFNNDYTGDVVNLNITQLFDLPGNHVLAFNISAAYGNESPEPFRLGGEKSILDQPVFGRERWALRGYESSVQVGTRIQTNTIEYRLPVVNIERNWDLLPIGIGQISANLFLENGAAWTEDTEAEYLSSVGFEINSELVLGYGLRLPVNIGFAYGLDDELGENRTYARLGYQF